MLQSSCDKVRALVLSSAVIRKNVLYEYFVLQYGAKRNWVVVSWELDILVKGVVFIM